MSRSRIRKEGMGKTDCTKQGINNVSLQICSTCWGHARGIMFPYVQSLLQSLLRAVIKLNNLVLNLKGKY